MQEYANQSYQTAKACYYGEYDLNLFTGEVISHVQGEKSPYLDVLRLKSRIKTIDNKSIYGKI